mgnify:CR=1 FL=1|jgi:hypothetical protein
MADSKYPDPTSAAVNRTVSQAPSTQQQTSSGSASGQQNSSSFTSEDISLLSPDNQKALDTLIQQLLGGGTADQKQSAADRRLITNVVQDLLQQYTKQQAFSDASGLMALNLKKSQEANAPAIAKSIEGAGTSASSMQGLLASNLANDSALAASALGAEQAKAYGGIQTNLSSLLENLSRPDNIILSALTNALSTAKGANVKRTLSTDSNQFSSQNRSEQSTTLINGGYQGGQTASVGQSSAPAASWDPKTATPMDNAVAANYSGDLRGIGTANSWNQLSGGANWYSN